VVIINARKYAKLRSKQPESGGSFSQQVSPMKITFSHCREKKLARWCRLLPGISTTHLFS